MLAAISSSELLILVTRTSVVLLAAALSFAALWSKGPERWPLKHQLTVAFAVRLAGLVGLIFFSGLRLPGDMVLYREHAGFVLEGLVPNRDFATVYGWLFSYVLAGALLVYDHAFSIAVLLQVCEFVGLALVLRTAGRFLPPERVRKACLLYLLNPAVVVCLWFGMQDEGVLILVLGLTMAMAESGRETAKGAVLGLVFHATKLLSAWSVYPFLLTKGRGAWIGFAAALLLIGGLILLAGASPLSLDYSPPPENGAAVADRDLSLRITYGNFWYLLARQATWLYGSRVPNLVALGALAVAAFWLWWVSRRGIEPRLLIVSGTGLFTLTYLLFAPMTPPYFVAPALLAVLVTLSGRQPCGARLAWVICWTTVALINYNLGALHLRMAASAAAIPAWFEAPYLVLQAVQIVLTAWVAWIAVRFMREEAEPDSSPH